MASSRRRPSPRAISPRRVALLPGTTLDDPTYARVLPSLCRALRERGWDARAFCPRRQDPAAVARFAPDLVNVHVSGRVSPPALRALRPLEAALVVTFQDLDHPDVPPETSAQRRSLRALVERSSALTALSPVLAAQVRRRFPGRLVSVIGNGVAREWFAPALPRSGPAVAVARLAPYKGIDVLLWAFAGFAGERADARLDIYGPDFQAGHYQRLARRLGLGARVRFRGWAEGDEVRRALARARLFVSASRRESYGTAVLEAMACGAPVLSTRTGAAPSLLTHGRSAWLVPPADPAALERGLRDLWDDSRARARLAGAAKRSAAAHTWERRAALYSAVFREALGER